LVDAHVAYGYISLPHPFTAARDSDDAEIRKETGGRMGFINDVVTSIAPILYVWRAAMA
jgi:hypothetical protein